MARGHRSQIKRERNAQKDTRPSATLSYARVSVQKACFVLDAIRGKDLQTALGIVTYNPRYASSLVKKLLESAAANAENNNNMDPAKLYVEECYANQGPIMKRVRPRAQGRAYRIEKRMSHITVVLVATNSPSLCPTISSERIPERVFFRHVQRLCDQPSEGRLLNDGTRS